MLKAAVTPAGSSYAVTSWETGFSRSVASSSESPACRIDANFTKELVACRAVEVANGAAEEKHEKSFRLRGGVGDFTESLEIRALEADYADLIDLTDFALTTAERGPGDVDGVVVDALTLGECFENHASFLTAAAAEFGDNHGRRQ